jgi:hypothetical protein
VRRSAIALGLLLTSACAAPARADDIALTTPGGKRLAGAPSLLRLVPPTGWRTSVEREHPVEDIIQRQISVGNGGDCTVSMDVMAIVQRRAYRRVRTLPFPEGRVPIVRRGTRGSLHWALGDQTAALREGHGSFGPPRAAAAAWLQAPRRLLPHGARAIHVRVEIYRELERFGPPDEEGYPALEPTRRQEASCARRQREATSELLPRLLPALRLVPA